MDLRMAAQMAGKRVLMRADAKVASKDMMRVASMDEMMGEMRAA